jgi:hypothetical protein
MTNYLENFFSRPEQFVAIACVAVLWLAFSAIGRVAGGRGRIAELDHLVGWAVVASAFTVFGVFAPVHFTTLALAAAVAALLALIWSWRRGDGAIDVPAGWPRIVVLGLPLLLLVSGMRGSQWDDFGHWLLVPRYLFETDGFPSAANPYTKAGLAAYPFGWHYITYLSSRLAGYLVESAGPLFNVLLCYGFGFLVVRLIRLGAGRDPDAAVSWRWAALAILATTLINPTFAQKVVLTAYAETSVAVVTGSAVVLAWLMTEALVDGDDVRAWRLTWGLGALLALLVNLKQATLVLVAMVVIAVILVAFRDRAVPFGRLFVRLPVIVGPAAIVYLAWRYHVNTELTGREMAVRPFGDWNIALLPQIVANMVIVLAKKGYYLALAVVLTVFGLRGLWRAATPLDRFAALAAFVFLGYNAFLLFAYVATFGSFDALRVASYWRYNMHLGFVLIAFSAFGCGMLWRRYLRERLDAARWAWVPLVLVTAMPFVFATKLRFDRLPSVEHFRVVGADIAALVKPTDGVYIADPAGSGESAMIASFELGDRAATTGYISAFTNDRLAQLQRAVAQSEVTVMLVYSTIDGFEGVFGLPLPKGQSHLLRRSDGRWHLVKSWSRPAG